MWPPAGPRTAFSSAYLEILEVGRSAYLEILEVGRSAYLEILEVGQLGLCDAASGRPEDGLQLCIP
jgi:hypothetical protein